MTQANDGVALLYKYNFSSEFRDERALIDLRSL